MKNSLYILTFLISSFGFSQVGINTENPTRDLDINGDLRVKTTTNKSADTKYTKVLVTDKDGNIDYWDKSKLLTITKEIPVETKKLYFSNAPDPNKIVACGKLDIRFSLSSGTQVNSNGDNIRAQIRLNSTADKNSEQVYYFYTEKVNKNEDNFNNQVGTATSSTFDKTIYTSIGNYKLNQLTEIFLTYPGDINYYRIVFLVRNMTYTTNNSNWTNSYGFTMICEKF